VTANYILFQGVRFNSGERKEVSVHPNTQYAGIYDYRFDLLPNKIIVTYQYQNRNTGVSFPASVSRQVLTGSFQYQNGNIRGRVTNYSYFGATDFNGEVEHYGSSWKVDAAFQDYLEFFDLNKPNFIKKDEKRGEYDYRYSSTPEGKILDHSSISGKQDAYLAPNNWWATPFILPTQPQGTQSSLTGTAKKADIFALTSTPEFGAGTADRITNFNPKEKDRLQIDVSNFRSDAAGTFKIAKNSKALTKALATTTDFVYLKSTGELYYNENGNLPGYGDGGIFAIIENKANITTKNVEFL
jgi:hypothetical protein